VSISPGDRAALLASWIKPSSDGEKTQQDRAVRMVQQAVDAHSAFNGYDVRVYPKGSYPNETNVRRDSDVDVVVQCNEVVYFDHERGGNDRRPSSPYNGPWTPEKWRYEVTKAATNAFGVESVDLGNIAIDVAEVPGSRPSIDIVPSFLYYAYQDGLTDPHEGSCVFPRSGAKIINWPQQQLDNGRTKNVRTGRRYKNYVRALKNAENTLVKEGVIQACASYFVECLVWNVRNSTLQSGDLGFGFRATLSELHAGLSNFATYSDYAEPNELKWLFRGVTTPGTPKQGLELVGETWKYLGY
jgi:hypothetical protein